MADFKQILKNRPLVISAILAVIAVFLVNAYLQSEREKARYAAEEETKQIATVFFARDTIRAGELIKKDMVEKARIPVRFMQPKAANSIEQIEGRIALVPIERGEYILTSKLMSRGEGANLAQLTPTGKRAVSIVVDNIAGLGGMLRPGDHVDVISIIPIPALGADGKQAMQAPTVILFQDVLVLAVGGKTETAQILAESKKKGEEEKAAPSAVSPVVTLALTPEEANIAAFLQEQQVRLRLALRSPADAQTAPTQPPASWDMVLRYLYPGYSPPVQQEQEQEKPPSIEIRRGKEQEERTAK
ncbi:MAG: Flp pilus assembly protein CpaB [Candidatus Omnitrophica bacterium]|nr:Flp pilus assembly protein CpaB [Candidatus Omnitrophota bacterium]